MRKPQFPDAVRLTEPASGAAADDDEGPREVMRLAGELGTILELFPAPDEAYLVEFSDEYGEAITFLTLKPHQFEVVYPLGKRVPEQVGA